MLIKSVRLYDQGESMKLCQARYRARAAITRRGVPITNLRFVENKCLCQNVFRGWLLRGKVYGILFMRYKCCTTEIKIMMDHMRKEKTAKDNLLLISRTKKLPGGSFL